MFGLNWNDVIPIMNIMHVPAPGAQPLADVFNWFFSLIFFFGMLSVIISWTIRVFTRS